jgi:flagellar FliJ protein
LKEKLEEQQKLAYAKTLARLYMEREARRKLLEEQETELNNFRVTINTKIHPGTIRRYNDYIALLKKRIQERDRNIEYAEIAVEKQRLVLVEAVRARKTIEKLKERKQEEFTREEYLDEQKILDGVVSFRYNDRQSNGG